jgi:hypothetical protein
MLLKRKQGGYFVPEGKMSRSAAIATMFIITLLFMCLIAFLVPGWVERGTPFLAGVLVGLGVVLAAVLSTIVQKPAPGEPEKPAAAPSVVDEKAVHILSILQKKGRLIDFLNEDIGGYQDSQIGAAVRNIHKGCREALAEYFELKPVIKENEGAVVTVEKGFDPSAVRLTGNVAGAPPFKGTLAHSGWRVVKTNLPPIPQSQDTSIIEPAEVELG